jgi:hypothetical protein
MNVARLSPAAIFGFCLAVAGFSSTALAARGVVQGAPCTQLGSTELADDQMQILACLYVYADHHFDAQYPAGLEWSVGTGSGTMAGDCPSSQLMITNGVLSCAVCTVGGQTYTNGQTWSGPCLSPSDTGSISYTCNNGAVTQTGDSCAAASAACGSAIETWSVGGVPCVGAIPNIPSGGSSTAGAFYGQYNGNNNTGSASFACNDGVLSAPFNATCAQSSCQGQEVVWSVYTGPANPVPTQGVYTDCVGLAPNLEPGTSATVNAIEGDSTQSPLMSNQYTGSATYSCINGVYVLQSGSTCTAAAP